MVICFVIVYPLGPKNSSISSERDQIPYFASLKLIQLFVHASIQSTSLRDFFIFLGLIWDKNVNKVHKFLAWFLVYILESREDRRYEEDVRIDASS